MPPDPVDDPAYEVLLELIRGVSRLDFRRYRGSTVVRRIAHRVSASGAPSLAAYAALALRSAEEVAHLTDALLVKTTSMFRDAATFAALREDVLPALLSRRAAEGAQALSVWVPGCSTGQEAYSLAMCLFEAGERVAPAMEFSLVASDVDPGALRAATRGLVAYEDAAAVPKPLASRWLVRDGGGFRIADAVRQAVVFTHHDLLDRRRRTPPKGVFASFDLVSCRNVLIYLREEAQSFVVQRLIDACEPGAVLVLGESESPPSASRPSLTALAPPVPIFGLR